MNSIKHSKPNTLNGAFLAAAALSAILLPSSAVGAQPGETSSKIGLLYSSDYCTQTTTAAYSACVYEGREEYWIGWGNCTNDTDTSDRNTCFIENRAQHAEQNEECWEQAMGREEVCELIGESRYDPQYEPDDFVDPSAIGDTVEPNAYFPLVPGSRWVYEAEDELIVVEVLEETKIIDGVPCAVVRDTVYEIPSEEGDEESTLQEDGDEEQGDLVEDTLDWYAQDKSGNVWYFGEISKNYEDGELTDLDGSWKSGDDGARAGILVMAMPSTGSVYRQEFLLGEAEDMATVVSLDAMPDLSEDNPGNCSSGCLQTEEWTPIEPDSIEYKFYEPGVGLIQEADPETGETLELVEYSN